MRVLMTTDTVGGVWTLTKELAGGLLRNGCSVALVSLGRAPSASQQSWADELCSQWGKCFRFEALDTALEWMQDNARALSDAAPTLLRIAEEFDADLLLTSQYCFGAFRCDIPRIVVAHSDVLSWAEACRPHGLERSQWLDSYTSLVQAGLDGADAVVAPTQWMLDALVRNFSVPPDRTVIPNGRTMPPFLSDSTRRMQAVTAGRLWDEAKNVKLLENVDSPIPLLIAGETRLQSESLSQTQDGSDIRLLGSLDEAGMLTLLRQSAIYICTSRYEPFGLAPLEAAQCGCAVLANDIPSLREVWGDSALYFTGPESLSSWLWRLSDHPWLLREAQEIAKQHASQFTAERMTSRYLELFRSVVKQSTLVATHVA
ncbi:glycosyltransferase family 4 protein [Occallatibacter savannae]|uniref:glycosyltransferase family 4 protein n=1 Tax=Occallatibacter savannae TaxID=1002691 RepID=UPI000D68775F|nr:glycosyltransferase family 4 protein [Occallatibacter savannae]